MANSMANISIVITPTIDGMLTNTAMVGSPGYELDLSDNTLQQSTLVDSIPPVLNWEQPVHNGGTYYTYGGRVQLETSATDNDQVAWVEFFLWDHLSDPPGFVMLGIDDTYPYRASIVATQTMTCQLSSGVDVQRLSNRLSLQRYTSSSAG
jgi:hypothetical protein